MIVTDIILSADMEEKILYDNPLLRHSMYVVDYDHYKRELIPWHWHGELELLYLESGACSYKTLEAEYRLEAGDAIYLKPGALHSFEPLCRGTVSCANLFMPDFLAGNTGGYMDVTFVAPMLGPSGVEAVVFRHDDPDATPALSLVRETIRLCRDEPDCYELRLRNTLSEIWILLYHANKVRHEPGKITKSTARDIRLRKMLLFIGEHYREPVSVANIAKAAEISERECYRLFRETLRQTPVAFVQRYRLQQAAAMLASDAGTITEIAGKVGFDSAAYFSKLFKREYGMTPVQMKKGNLAGSL